MIYGYARVSTDGQMKNGTSLEEQTKQLREAGAEKIVSDDYTGTKVNRPEFTKLLEQLRPGDKLIVTKFDRFARSAIEGNQVLRDLLNRGVSVHILNMGLVDNSPTGRLIATVLLAFSEFERDMIIERTQSGRAARRREAEAKGEVFQDFRPRKLDEKQTDHAMELLDAGKSYKEVADLLGVSKSTLIRRRREQRAEQLRQGDIIPLNIHDAIYQADPEVYSFLNDHPAYTKSLENKLKELSTLTKECVELAETSPKRSDKKRTVRDQKLNELIEKVLVDMEKHS